jgi:hypothetical protein
MRCKSGKVIILSLAFIFALCNVNVLAQTYYLDVTTDPLEVLMIDPSAVSGEGWYSSGFVVVDSVQTVISGIYRYEFVEWVSNDNEEYLEYDEENELTGNQGAYFMDGDRIAVARYEQVNTLYYLTLVSEPDYLAINEPSILVGEGWYSSGDEAVFSAEPLVTDWVGMVRWEFNEWTTIYGEPTSLGNPATYFMDGDYTFVADYDVHSYYLDVTTNPAEVLAIDPNAVSGAGWYSSGHFGIVDATQTIVSGPYRYEFTGWETDDNEEYEQMTGETLSGNQGARFMDSQFTMVAVYERYLDVEYEHVFNDDVRGTLLRISTDDGYFQFSTPDNDYEIKQAGNLIVLPNSLSLIHRDSEINLAVLAFPDESVDFCLAYARDVQSGQRYVLRDRIGPE